MPKANGQENKGFGAVAGVSAGDTKGFEAEALAALISKAVTNVLTRSQPTKGDRADAMETAVVSREGLKTLTGLGETTLWRLEKAGDFPAKLKLSARRVGWKRAEVEAWLETRRAA